MHGYVDLPGRKGASRQGAMTLEMMPRMFAFALVPCPATRWSPATGASPTGAARTILRPVHTPPFAAGDTEAELAWLHENGDYLLASLGEAGALHFRGFTAATTKRGFRRFCEASTCCVEPPRRARCMNPPKCCVLSGCVLSGCG